jgi:hypothetical protein
VAQALEIYACHSHAEKPACRTITAFGMKSCTSDLSPQPMSDARRAEVSWIVPRDPTSRRQVLPPVEYLPALYPIE